MKNKINKVEHVSAEIWELSISNGVLEATHGISTVITEVYIPSYNIAFNLVDGITHIFRPISEDINRYSPDTNEIIPSCPKKIKKIKLPSTLVEDLNTYLKLKENLNEQIKLYYNEE